MNFDSEKRKEEERRNAETLLLAEQNRLLQEEKLKAQDLTLETSKVEKNEELKNTKTEDLSNAKKQVEKNQTLKVPDKTEIQQKMANFTNTMPVIINPSKDRVFMETDFDVIRSRC